MAEAKKEVDLWKGKWAISSALEKFSKKQLEAMREFLTKIQKQGFFGPENFTEIDELLQKEGKE